MNNAELIKMLDQHTGCLGRMMMLDMLGAVKLTTSKNLVTCKLQDLGLIEVHEAKNYHCFRQSERQL